MELNYEKNIISDNLDKPSKPLLYFCAKILYKSKIRDDNKYLDQIQNKPNGIAEAFIIGEKFIANDDVCLILGDNIFYGKGLPKLLKDTVNKVENGDKSIIFGYFNYKRKDS